MRSRARAPRPDRPPPTAIPFGTLLFLSAALMLGLVPLLPHLTPWIFILVAGAIGYRIFAARRGHPLPITALNMVLLVVAVAAAALTYHSLIGTEAGMTILLVLLATKILETRDDRDVLVLILVAYFLCLGTLLFSQDLIVCFYVSLEFIAVTAAALAARRMGGRIRLWRSWHLAGRLVLQSLPLVLLLFLAFPRIEPFRLQLLRTDFNQTGISDSMQPGGFEKLAVSDEIAFRVEFPDGNMPPNSAMYWRAGVLWQEDGLSWTRGSPVEDDENSAMPGGKLIRQDIILQPHGQRWLFALDRPLARQVIPHAQFQQGGFWQSERAIYAPHRYQVVSAPQLAQQWISPSGRERALRVSPEPSTQVRELVEGWRQVAGPDDRKVVEEAIHFLRRGKFVYTLSPGPYDGPHALDEFLFQRKRGFCEHYAGTVATLMRVAGIPARVVIGYQGGEFNSLGNYLIVRQSHAHAWCEVWLDGSGWIRVDPTTAVAPERMSADFTDYRPGSEARNGTFLETSAAAWSVFEAVRQVRLTWDNLNHQWDLHVLNYDVDRQNNFLASIGLSRVKPSSLLAYVITVVMLVLGSLGFYMRWRSAAKPDPVAAAYAELCYRLDRLGVPRELAEGPLELRDRASTAIPGLAKKLRAIMAMYVSLRYGEANGLITVSELQQEVRKLPLLRHRSRRLR